MYSQRISSSDCWWPLRKAARYYKYRYLQQKPRTAAVFFLLVCALWLAGAVLTHSHDPHHVWYWSPRVQWLAAKPLQLSAVPATAADTLVATSRMFFLHSRIPLPHHYGNDVRLSQVLTALKEQSVVVDYYGWRATNHDSMLELQQLQSLVLGTVHVPLDVEDDTMLQHQRTVSMQQLICQQQYQVFVLYLWMLPSLYLQYVYEFASMIKQLQPESQLVLLTDDVHHVRQQRIDCSSLGDTNCHSTAAEAMKVIELHLLEMADLIVAVTDDDAIALRQLAPRKHVEVVHMISQQPVTAAQRGTESPEGRTTLLFIGADNPVNEASVLWFCHSILYLVQQSVPEVELHIVGSVNCNSCSRVHNAYCHGQADDLEPFLRRARVFVAPIVAGTGINTKNLLALAAGVPLVTTTVGSRALHFEQSPDAALIADTETLFANAVVRLLSDDALWNTSSRAGKQHVLRHFGPTALEQDIDHVLSALGWTTTTQPTSIRHCNTINSIERLSAVIAG